MKKLEEMSVEELKTYIDNINNTITLIMRTVIRRCNEDIHKAKELRAKIDPTYRKELNDETNRTLHQLAIPGDVFIQELP